MRKDTLSGMCLVALPVLFLVGFTALFITLPRIGIGFKNHVFVYIFATVAWYVLCSFPLKKIVFKTWKAAFFLSGVAAILGCVSAGLFTLCITEEACEAYNAVEGITDNGS